MNFNKLKFKHYIIDIPKINERQYLLLRHILMTVEAAKGQHDKYFLDIDLFSDLSEDATRLLLKSNLELTVVNKKDNTWRNFHAINEIYIKDKKVFFRPTSIIVDNGKSSNFSEIDIFLKYILFNGIRHKQTLLFLDYIVRKKSIKFDLNPDELREITEVEESQYSNFSSFKRFVIERAIREINEKTNHKITCKIGKKEGRRITILSFMYQTV